MTYKLPELPYSKNALAPYISEETLDYHHGKHHQTYVTNLNNLVQNRPLEELIRTESGAIFNNAAQIWNHTFYWHSLSPQGGQEPKDRVQAAINRDFGSFEAFKNLFTQAALGQFGSGWAWLVQDSAGKLVIRATSNAESPLQTNENPILTCDVWEHAYYIDYRNARAKYVDAWWNLVNWDFANQNLQSL
ncbi:MAG: superoxide dismutase [Myxococcaceae bacterium]|nr:superoxide dismutase [Myxococcaceae bacterium]MBH2006545.1 superoxide dismutase [Myxococcaceae bacterium]